MLMDNDNPINQYSIPINVEKTNLSTIYTFNPSDSNKGRLFMPVYNKELPLKFKTGFVYVVKFFERDNTAGNHYHEIKKELLIPLSGEFKVHLEDITTKEKEERIFLSSEDKAMYIKPLVAHRVISKEDTGLLLVLASIPSMPNDEIRYMGG
ncbi:MAG: hypothetical protein COV33_01180 [Candidatus Zambryskibacteria bacterium CG10_big_fil_rev_8_21_14_0_10_34_34]|uniref:Sugar 3,4-ketoisomerase QdtA cupin domain-containing protein n=1 Tax=Candidatus Zambryskibacteria bacterium CG10_big_fil_rev_8_21_14_0_10_34_34 TaxID=1975114 RepID=A0A2H0R113_9BACT|nr:MAG: hypothetical protein COV33_01180 [Candidatus Zambryskibacteria bacterium CG10_big_fil_rev_8_21_14_0_10_34_34]